MGPVVYHCTELPSVLQRKIHSSRSVKSVAKLLTNYSNCGCVNERSNFFNLIVKWKITCMVKLEQQLSHSQLGGDDIKFRFDCEALASTGFLKQDLVDF